jgi:UDP-glucose 4-epimerase
LDNKIILIIGGAGFIGSHLCEYLYNNTKSEIYSLDNYSTGKKENHIKGVNYLKGESKNIFDIINIIPDIVFHLGEYSRVEQSFDEIELIYEYNVLGTQKVFDFCLKHKCKLIYSGSSTKFSNFNNLIESPYSFFKRKNTEKIIGLKEAGLNYCIVYFYNVYGGREIRDGKYATVIAKFKKLYKLNKPLTVVKPASQKRNFTHIDDIISGLIIAAEKGVGDNYGIGSFDSYSILEVANLFGSKIKFIKKRKGNRLSAELKNKKMINLGWCPKNNLKDFIDDFKNKNQLK